MLFKSSSATAPELTGTNGSIPSISSAKATVSGFTNNTWGYKPTKKSGSSWSNLAVQHGSTTYNSGYYLPGPTTTDDILDTTDAANTTANEYNLALATKLDLNTPSGSYGGTFTVTVVPNEIPGILLTFDANGGNFSGQPTNVLTHSIPEIVSYTQDTKTTSTTNSTTASGTHKTSISDGTQYASNANYYQDITLNTNAPTPYDLTIYFATEGINWDWICVFDGTSYTPGSSDACTNASAAAPTLTTSGGGTVSGNKVGSGGSNKTAHTDIATYKLNSKTARIYFHSDSGINSYGFWAEFTGGGDVVTQELTSGTYIDKPSDRTGYVFLGWATTPNATTPDWTYDPNAFVMENTTVYAVWVQEKSFDQAFAEAGKSKQNGYYKMQDMLGSICAAIQPDTGEISTQLIDTRDNKIYWVSKLKDGHCWMTQNLDFVISTSGTELKTTDSNVSGNKTITAVNGWTNTDISFYEGNDKYLPNGTDSATDITCNSTANGGENCHYHVGNYYNWTAATAGSGTSSVVNADAPESICPKGWRLPTSNSYTANYSFGALTNAYGITNNATGTTDAALLTSPLWFIRSGRIDRGNLLYHGTDGYSWSSRAHSVSSIAYSLSFDSGSVNPSTDYNFHDSRYFGMSVRCVAE